MGNRGAAIATGLFLIILGLLLFRGHKNYMETWVLPDPSTEWVRVEGTLEEVLKMPYVGTTEGGRRVTEYEYIGNYKAQFRGKEITLQRSVKYKKNLKPTHVFYLEPSPYHDGYERKREEVDEKVKLLPYLWLLVSMMGLCIMYSGRKRKKQA